MTARTKLAAYAPAFVEVLEELEKRAGERIERLENGQLGAKADVVLELHKRIDQRAEDYERLSQRIDQLESVPVLALEGRVTALEARAGLSAHQGGNHEQRIKALEEFRKGFEEAPDSNPSGENPPILCGTFGMNPVNEHIEQVALLSDHVRELVLAARALYNDTYESRGSWVIESADQLTALGMALKPFEAIK